MREAKGVDYLVLCKSIFIFSLSLSLSLSLSFPLIYVGLICRL